MANPNPKEEDIAVPACKEQSDPIQPCIYLACLAAYNSGYLHGAWVDAAQDAWGIWGEVKAMLEASPIAEADEWAIHDYEGFAGLRIREFASFEEVSRLAGFVMEYGALGAELVAYFDEDVDEAEQAMADAYLGCHASLADYMHELTEEAARPEWREREATSRQGELF